MEDTNRPVMKLKTKTGVLFVGMVVNFYAVIHALKFFI